MTFILGFLLGASTGAVVEYFYFRRDKWDELVALFKRKPPP
jgi:hypothetical protein